MIYAIGGTVVLALLALGAIRAFRVMIQHTNEGLEHTLSQPDSGF